MSADVLLDVEHLTKRFGGLTAIDDLNLSIQRNEIRSLIGPNGAGKSTFLKMVIGQLSPTEGSIRYDGEDLTRLEPHHRVRRGLGIKFQVPGIYPDLSVAENLHLPLQRTTERVAIDAEIDRLLDEFNLAGERYTTVDNLAHGQQQWLEIAMAVSLEPELLLLDEPVAGMSISEKDATRSLIQDLNQNRDITMILIEHDMDFIEKVSQGETVTVLNQGTVLTEGPFDEVQSDDRVREVYLGEANE